MGNLAIRIRQLEETVRELTSELEEVNRRTANIIRLGVVEQAFKQHVDVKTGDNLAKRIPFFVDAMGRVRHYRRPTAGEQCILINLGSGDNLNHSVALFGLCSDQFPFPTLKENEVMTDYSGGMTELYDLDAGSLVCKYPGGVKIYADIWQDGNYKAAGDITDHTRSMQGDRDIYNGHDHSSPETGFPTSQPEQQQ